MSLLNILGISGSAVSAQSQRLNVVASNLANADSVAGPDGQSYKARQVVFQSEPTAGATAVTPGVRVSNVVEDTTPGKRIHDPKNPMADADGYVTQSNVNVIEEMVNMISASRSYQNNIEVMNTTQQLLAKTLQLGQ
ncbi:MAG: flagellar basal body rod protein FlgC [Burkholderiaceae bacterium]|jgi:flagellar basal-body rod protein FlgC|nr:flagellar basal body rod protein FlgC [Burkholderiaceae bacterium]HMN63417.1 flagellar basal body rod protein FlgC [Burkholderiaceae bacterium]